MDQEDKLLVKKVLKGKRAASKKLYERHETYWFCLCLRYGRNRTEGEDIFQEGVSRVFEVIKKFDPNKGSFKAWSNKVIVNEALKYLKKHQWETAFEDMSSLENEQLEIENATDSLSAKELIEMIQQLPTGYRLVFNMYEIEGYSHKEIAEALNISVSTSKSQLFKAKKKLQRKLNILF